MQMTNEPGQLAGEAEVVEAGAGAGAEVQVQLPKSLARSLEGAVVVVEAVEAVVEA